MKKLTKRNKDGSIDFCGKYGDPPYPVVTQETIEKMEDYEDLGFTPEEIAYMSRFFKEHTSAEVIADDMKTVAKLLEWSKWKEAEEEGRLVVLPVKVRDTVYFSILGKIIEKQVFSIVTFSNSIRIYCEGTSEYFRPEHFGKTVFLTREEAEAALEKMKGETND